jgi:hypothetical protein
MKISSWDYYELSPSRLLTLGALISLAAGAAFFVLTSDVLGGTSLDVSVVVVVVVFYLTLSFPKRLVDSEGLSQSREAITLATASSASLEATHSRSRALLALDSSDKAISDLLSGVKRNILLGFSVAESINRIRGRIISDSTRRVLESVASVTPEMVDEGGEETQGITQSSQLSEESKVPLFMAVSFFTPIMLTLFAVLTHQSNPLDFAELIVVQLVVLDVALYFSSSERKKLS